MEQPLVRRGRPRAAVPRIISKLYLRPEDAALVGKLAERLDLSRNRAIIEAIRELAKREGLP